LRLRARRASAFLRSARRPRQGAIDRAQHVTRHRRLGQEIVVAGGERGGAILRPRVRRERNRAHQAASRRRPLPDAADHRQPVLFRHADVREHQLGRVRLERRHRRADAVHGLHVATAACQQRHQQVARRLVVVDDEDRAVGEVDVRQR